MTKISQAKKVNGKEVWRHNVAQCCTMQLSKVLIWTIFYLLIRLKHCGVGTVSAFANGSQCWAETNTVGISHESFFAIATSLKCFVFFN